MILPYMLVGKEFFLEKIVKVNFFLEAEMMSVVAVVKRGLKTDKLRMWYFLSIFNIMTMQFKILDV